MKKLSIYFLFILSIYPVTAFGQQPPNGAGEIYGTVYQKDLEQRVASAQIRITGTNQRVTTDPNGEFRFRDLPAGKYTLTASASDYRLLTDIAVTVEPGETTELKIYLERVTVLLDEVEVTGERAATAVGRQTLGASEIQRVPGAVGDALRALQALPSVGVANDFSGALYIRGGSDEDNLYYFDRVPIGYPYHFGGIVSSLSSEVIERIDVYAGGYGAEFGVDSQAVIDIYSRNKNTDGFRAKFNLNVLYSEGLLEGKIGDQGFWYVAGRRSYIDLFLGSLSFDSGQITAFPRFWDYQIKGGYKLSEKHQLSLNLFASGDSFALKLDGEDVDQDIRGNVSFGSGFAGAGIHLRSLFTDRLTSFLSLTRSDFQFDVSVGRELSLTIDAPDYLLREDLTYTLTPKHQLESGVILGLEPGRAIGRFIRPPDEGEVDYDPRFLERQTFDESVLWHNGWKHICRTGIGCYHSCQLCSVCGWITLALLSEPFYPAARKSPVRYYGRFSTPIFLWQLLSGAGATATYPERWEPRLEHKPSQSLCIGVHTPSFGGDSVQICRLLQRPCESCDQR